MNWNQGLSRGVSIGLINTIGGRGLSTLNTAYVQQTSGNGLAIRFNAIRSTKLEKLYLFADSVVGTGGTLRIELRLAPTNSNSTPFGSASSLLLTQSVAPPATGKKWFEVNFDDHTLTKGNWYWILINNQDPAPTSNYVVLVNAMTDSQQDSSLRRLVQGYTSTNGYTSNSSITNGGAGHVFKYADGTLIGVPWTNTAIRPSANTKRGFKIEGLINPRRLLGFASSFPTINRVEVYDGSALPTDDPLASFPTNAHDSVMGTMYWGEPGFILEANTAYRVVATSQGGNTTAPTCLFSEDALTPADVLATGIGGGTIYFTEASGGAWVDFPTHAPQQQMLLDEIAGGGGGSAISGSVFGSSVIIP